MREERLAHRIPELSHAVHDFTDAFGLDLRLHEGGDDILHDVALKDDDFLRATCLGDEITPTPQSGGAEDTELFGASDTPRHSGRMRQFLIVVPAACMTGTLQLATEKLRG